MARTSRKQKLQEASQRVGLYVAAYGPGDGVTRYRFFKSRKPVSYFIGDGIYTALGIAEAETFVKGRASRRGR